MNNTDQSGYTGRTDEPGGHYHDGCWYTDDECGCPLGQEGRREAIEHQNKEG